MRCKKRSREFWVTNVKTYFNPLINRKRSNFKRKRVMIQSLITALGAHIHIEGKKKRKRSRIECLGPVITWPQRLSMGRKILNL
jgi:hypothetical protein